MSSESHQLGRIADNLDRIAIALEATAAASTNAAKHIATQDPAQQVRDVLGSLQENPALAPLFAQVEQMMLGQKSKKQGEVDAPRSD